MRFTFLALAEGAATIQFAYFRSFDLSNIIYEDVLPVSVEANETTAVGGWSPFGDPTDKDQAVFDSVISGMLGVTYKILNVSQQIVDGINYRFVCEATPSTLDPKSYKVAVCIYAQAGETSVVTKIEKILG